MAPVWKIGALALDEWRQVHISFGEVSGDGVELDQDMIWRVAIWFFLSACLARADEHGDQLMAAGVKEFTAAYQAWDGQRFGAAAELFRQASTNAPVSCTNFYWLGAAEFHRMLQLRSLPAHAREHTRRQTRPWTPPWQRSKSR